MAQCEAAKETEIRSNPKWETGNNEKWENEKRTGVGTKFTENLVCGRILIDNHFEQCSVELNYC